MKILEIFLVLTGGHFNAFCHSFDDFSFSFDDSPGIERVKRMDTDYPLEEYLGNCGKTYKLGGRMKKIKFISPFYSTRQYPPDVECNWSFIGSRKCKAELQCTSLDLRKLDEDCEEEFLKVSDGLGGEKIFCGKNEIDPPIVSSNGGRDLYIKLKISENSRFLDHKEGVFCEVRCSQGGEVQELPVTKKMKTDKRCVCGLGNQDNRIVGGENAASMEFPWLAAVVKKGTRAPVCGGAIINDRYILTATHCFFFSKTTKEEIEVLLHAHILDQNLKYGWRDVPMGVRGSIQSTGYNLSKLTDEDEKSIRIEVDEIITHPLFTTQYDFDVALLKLKSKIDFGALDAPTPICLPPIGSFDSKFVGESSMVAGWGLQDQSAGGTTRVLQKLSVPILPMETCQEWMPYRLTSRMMCAGYAEGVRDACTGDSGGPLGITSNSKQVYQIGIVSWGEGCAQKHRPGMYSRVTELQQWILHHANQGKSKWCRTSLND